MADEHRAFLDATLPHLAAVHRLARHLAADPAAAEDLVQETYLRAFTGFAGHTGPNTRAWLVAICLNVARSAARHQARRPPEVLGPVPERPTDDVAAQALAELDREHIAWALDQLPAEQRISIVLMDLIGHSAAEVAAILGCPRGTVLARVHRGRRRLAGLLVGRGVTDGRP